MNTITRTALLLPALALALGCGREKPPRLADERLPRIEVVMPLRTSLLRKLDLAANVDPLLRVDLSARVPGVVEFVETDIGKAVRKGDVVCKLAVPELEADKAHKEALLAQAREQQKLAEEMAKVTDREVAEARKQEERYKAETEYQELKYKRIQGLVRQGAQDKALEDEAKQQMEAARAAWAAATAAVSTRQAKALAALAEKEVAKQRVEVAQTEVEKLKTQISFATIRAPFDGIITARRVDPGAVVKDPATVLLTIMQMHRVRVLIDVPQRDVPLINTDKEIMENGTIRRIPGDQVIICIPSLAEVVPPRGEFRGTITRLGKSLDQVTRTMRVEVELDNPRNRENNTFILRPGMYGTATVILDERANVLTIPSTALVRRSETQVAVYVVEKPQGVPPRGILKLRDVELGLDDGKNVEIRSGLKETDLVVARGNGVLRVDDPVIALLPE